MKRARKSDKGLCGTESQCQHCMVRYKMQQKYLGEIDELYGEDFNIVYVTSDLL